jgi:hypothetical protein
MTSVALPQLRSRCAHATNAAVATDTEIQAAGDGTRSLVVRRVNLRPVAALALVFLIATGVLAVGAAMVTWMILDHMGLVDHVERLMVDLGFETFDLHGGPLLRVLAIVAGSAVVAGTLLAVVAAAVFNLVNGLVGGLSVRVAERPSAAPAMEAPPAGSAGVGGGNVYVRVSEAEVLETPAPTPSWRSSVTALERRRPHGSDRARGRGATGSRDSRPAAT